jgi:hypothetical protein
MSKVTMKATDAKRGRPVVEGSKRQAVLAAREAKRANGIEIKRGRPKVKQDDHMEIEVELENA